MTRRRGRCPGRGEITPTQPPGVAMRHCAGDGGQSVRAPRPWRAADEDVLARVEAKSHRRGGGVGEADGQPEAVDRALRTSTDVGDAEHGWALLDRIRPALVIGPAVVVGATDMLGAAVVVSGAIPNGHLHLQPGRADDAPAGRRARAERRARRDPQQAGVDRIGQPEDPPLGRPGEQRGGRRRRLVDRRRDDHAMTGSVVNEPVQPRELVTIDGVEQRRAAAT